MKNHDAEPTPTIPFGHYKGKYLTDAAIPDGYIKWLALRGKYTDPRNRFETTWKVPIVLSIEARREMERRGYQRADDHYERVTL